MNSEHQSVEEYYESLKTKYPDINQQLESLIQSESSESFVKFEMLFQYPTYEDARELPETLYHPADDNSGLIQPYENSGKFYSGFTNKKQELDSFRILTGYHAFIAIAQKNNGKLVKCNITKI